MKRITEKAVPIYCESDTEEAQLMQEISDLIKKRQEIDEQRKNLIERLIRLAHEDGDENPVLKTEKLMAAWYTNPRALTKTEWETLKEKFPEAYAFLNGGTRETKPFFVVTQIKNIGLGVGK